VAAEPYETVGFKIPDATIDRTTDEGFFTHWDQDAKQYTIQLLFKHLSKDKSTVMTADDMVVDEE